MNEQYKPSLKLKISAVAGLFFLSPFIGEFLLGNISITALWLLPVLALLYGSGSILIRETVVRLKLRWNGILILCLVYGIMEEAFATQSLFDPNYLGLRLLDFGYIKTLGIGAWWTVYVLGIHIIWSTAVPIALMDGLSPKMRNTPYMGKIGYGVLVALFLIVCISPIFARKENDFTASAAQFTITSIIIALLIFLAITIGRSKKQNTINKEAPKPILLGLISFFLGSAFMLTTIIISRVSVELNVAMMILLLSAGCILFWRWHKRVNWSVKHFLAVTGGLLFTYAWFGFIQKPSVGNTTPLIDLTGNAIFAGISLILFYMAWRKNASKTNL
jgi:hypothetical protein